MFSGLARDLLAAFPARLPACRAAALPIDGPRITTGATAFATSAFWLVLFFLFLSATDILAAHGASTETSLEIAARFSCFIVISSV